MYLNQGFRGIRNSFGGQIFTLQYVRVCLLLLVCMTCNSVSMTGLQHGIAFSQIRFTNGVEIVWEQLGTTSLSFGFVCPTFRTESGLHPSSFKYPGKDCVAVYNKIVNLAEKINGTDSAIKARLSG